MSFIPDRVSFMNVLSSEMRLRSVLKACPTYLENMSEDTNTTVTGTSSTAARVGLTKNIIT